MTYFLLAQQAGFWHELFQRSGVAIIVGVGSAAASFFLGRWWGRYRARQQWERKEFFGRINVSLNVLADGKLKIRTIMERSLEEVFLNVVAVQKVRAASLRTTLADPLLPIPKEDCWYLLNFVLNAVAEQFSHGNIRQDAGEAVRTVTYAVCLTCEVVGEERIRKVRAMLIRKELLEDFPYRDSLPVLENPWHETRVQTLRKMANAYKSRPEHFLHLEICL
jgi:hypothetical protein